MSERVADLLRQRLDEFGLAVGLLTRFPLPGFQPAAAATATSSFWAYPLAGALVGLAAGAVFYVSITLGFGALPSVLLGMGAGLLAAGGFHEDGLSDFWDGLGGGNSREAKLIIMRDSRIGSYGVLALMLMLALQASFIVNIQHYAGTGNVFAALVAAESAARGALALPLFTLVPARRDGLGASMKDMKPAPLAAAAAIAGVICVILLGAKGLAMIAGAICGAAFVAVLAWRFLGGFTGDVLGAAATTARVSGLAALALAVTP